MLFAWRPLIMYDAASAPCASSGGTTRKNVLKPWLVRVGLVADGLTLTRLASLNNGSEAFVAPEKAGPTTATTLSLSMSFCAAVGPCAGSPTSSELVNFSLKGRSPLELACSTAGRTP